ncbi:MAG: hypothetical protein KKE62_05290 [Proteobacteria bacterium]|nr:hypothetical protein [Pseudomonadota bacterium]MBU1388862.1 hypothetical protein [Pseudomonadota bacterium]MBU1542243.1 hypothetical protein [Pseudomonadota bacterium]MBU2429350.1 hypothetical protein [Pseudomonadota bacterium]MBU2480467.1 hypothetical protein [Pseudomonadota bacterium]
MKKFLTAVCCFVLFSTSMASAGQGGLGMALKAGTLGAGIEGTMGITDTVNARLGFNYFSMDHDLTESNVEYEFELDLMSIALLLDWHPLDNGFRFTAGALYNGNEFDATGKPTAGSYSIHNTTYTAAEVGTLSGSIDFDDFAPYVGIGYGNAVGKNKRWCFAFDLGLMYQGSPDVRFSANGTSSGIAAFQSDLEAERRQLEDELDDFSFYPVISFGVSYKF